MKIGFTYDLRSDYLSEGYTPEQTAEFDSPGTIDAICKTLNTLGYQCDRIGNIRALASRITSGESWPLVFNIAEGMGTLGREAQIPALLDAYSIPYTFSESHVLALCLHKGFTKAVLRESGVPTTESYVISSVDDASANPIPYPVFIKPLGGGTGMGIDSQSRISDPRMLAMVADRLFAENNGPLLIEPFLSGREFTTGMIGTGAEARCVGTLEISIKGDGLYSYEAKQNYRELASYTVPEQTVCKSCEQLALAIWHILGCRDAGRIDFKMDDSGQIQFMEINPLAGLNPVDSDLPMICYANELGYEELIGGIMDSALRRMRYR